MKKVLNIAIVLCIVFIWSNSMKSIPSSLGQSEGIRAIVESILINCGFEEIVNSTYWNADSFRKLAHFIEFGGLAMIITAYAYFSKKSYLLVLSIIPIAMIDETIQIFSKRGPRISDVCIDCMGGLFGCIFVLIVIYVIKKVIQYIEGRYGYVEK